MFHSGLVSVSFRKLTCEEIIGAVKTAGLDGIEWGGDIHVPAGDLEKAVYVKKLTSEAGLQIFSYGSYFRLLQSENALLNFETAAKTAHELGAPIIRIWAGQLSSKEADEDYFHRAVSQTRQLCDIAKTYSITVCFEYHRGTLTDSSQSALRLVKETNRPNVGLYWQPNPDLTEDENLTELRDVLPFVNYIHVFHWDEKGGKLDLQSGRESWLYRIETIRAKAPDCTFMLEFIKDDSIQQFQSDGKALQEFLFKK